MNKILAFVVLSLGAGYLLLARLIPGEVFYDPVGPRLFPTLIALGMLGCGAGIAWEAFGIQADAEASTERDRTTNVGHEVRRLIPIAALCLLVLGYALLIEKIGYVFVSIILIFSVSSYLNRGRHLLNASVSTILTLVIYYCFTEFLRIRLPSGLLDSFL